MDGEPGEITPDIKGTTAEVKNTPTDAVASFNFLLSKYDSAITSGRITNPEHGWCLLGLKAGKEKTLGAKPPRITQTIDVPAFENTPLFRQKEGIPVNGLIDFINEEVANSLSPEEKATLLNQLEQIKKNSKLYKESKAHQNPKKFRSRVAMEANLISKNDAMREMILQQLRAQRAQNGNHEEPSPHDLDVAIWLKAENIMNTRIEFFPPARQKSQNEIQNPVDDTPIDDDIEEELKKNFYDGEQEQNDQKNPLIFDPKRFKPQHNADGSQVESTGTPEPNLADVLNEDATPEAQPEDSEALPTSDDTEITVTPEDIAQAEAEKEPQKDVIDIKKDDLDENQTEEGEIKTIRATLLNASEQRTDEERAEAEKLVDEYIRLKGFKDLLKLPKKTWWRWTRSRQIDLMRRSMKEKDRGARISAAYSRGVKNDEDKATVERFQAGGFSKDRNERLEVLNTDDPKQKELRQKIVDQFIAPIANGEEMTEGQLQERLAQFVSENIKNYEQLQNLFGPDMNKYGELSADFATSILEAGQQAKKAMEAHNKSLAEIDKYIEISIGNAAGYTTDQRSRVEKWIASARARESKVKVGLGEASRFKGAILNPLFVGVAASIATNVALSGGRMGGRAVGFISLGVGAGLGGLAGGARRYGETGEDMRRHMMETEMGAENLAGGKRGRLSESLRKMTGGSNREELEKIRTRLKATSARSLIEGGSNDVVTGEAQESIQGLLSASNPERVLRRIADINARQRFGAETRTAAITYDNMALDLRDLELKKLALEKHLAELTDGMTPEEKIQLQETRSQFMTDYQTRLMESREDMEASFKRYRLKQALKAGTFGGAIGIAGALGGSFIAEKTLNATPNVRIPGMSVQAPEINAPFTTESLQGVEVGDTTIFREADNSSRIVFPDGTEHLVANSEILENGNVRIEGALTDEVRDAFEAENFTVKELDPIKRDITLLDSTTPLRDSAVGAHPTSIPEGTAWIQDSAEPSKWDLVIQDLPDDHPNKILIDNAQFDETGKINYESAIAIVSQTTEQIPGEKVIQTQEVFGTEGLWTEERTQITKREWYAYDTPLSDHNELRAYNSVFDAGNGMKGVEWDMSNMTLGYQNNLNPNPIDVQQVIREGQAGFAFTLPDEQKNIVWVSDLSDGIADGKIRLDPNDFTNRINPSDPNSMKVGELSRIVLNQEKLTQLPTGSLASEVYGHQDVFQLGRNGEMGYVEAGRLVDREDGKILQAFATARGSNPTPSSISIPVEGPPKTIFDTLVTLDQPIIDTAENPVYELIPPSEREIYPIPIIPIPRWTLEKMGARPGRETLTPYGYYGYYENLSPEQKAFYKKRFSERIRNNPHTNLDASVEIPDYFKRQTSEHMNELENFLKQPEMSEPMDENCDAIVCVPVYDLGEGKIIENTLNQYLEQIDAASNKQAIDASKFEIILFLNHPLNPSERNAEGNRKFLEEKLGHSYLDGSEERVNNGKPEAYDTEAVIKKFMQEHPDLKIRIMKKEFETRPLWGEIIKPVYDIALLRASRRNDPYRRDPLIITNDADVVNMSPTYLRDILQTMDMNEIAAWRDTSIKKLDGLVGNTDMVKEIYKDAPGFLLSQRLFNFLESQNRGNRSTQGRNTILRGSTYAAIGGVNAETNAGADGELGSIINIARDNSDPRHPHLHSAWLQTDPRREYDSWRQGIPLVANWNDWDTRNVYGKDWREKFKEAAGSNPTDIKTSLEREVNAYVDMGWWGNLSDVHMQRSLSYLGLRNHQADLDRAFYRGKDYDSPEVKALISTSFSLSPNEFHIEEVDQGGAKRKRVIIDKKEGHIDYHLVSRPDAKGETRQYIVIDDLSNVNRKLTEYTEDERWKVTERKIKEAKSHPAVARINDQYYAEFTDYEEFNGVYGEIFVSKDYPWSPDLSSNPKPKVIDLGGHIGLSVLHWKSIAPDARVTVVEPNPQTAKVLKRNIQRNSLGNVNVVEAAATSKNGPVELYMPKKGVDFRWGDFVGNQPKDESKYDKISVPSVRLSELIDEPVDILKLDIEGSEGEVLKEAESRLHLVRQIIMEFHNDPTNPGNSYTEAINILRRQGFEISVNHQGKDLNPDSIDLTKKIFVNVIATRPGDRSLRSGPTHRPKSLDDTAIPTPAESVMESSVELGSAERASTRSGSATEKKPSNAVNQDAVIENANAGFVGTFDGVGGHGGGDIASRITANRFAQELGILPPNPTRDEIKEAFQKASRGSSQDIKAFLASHPERPGISDMATTASVVKVFEENGEKYAYILQSGDSRSYTLNSDGTITQISSDQSIIERDIATGTITADEARKINDALDNAQSTDDIRSKNPAWLRYWNERNRVNGVIDAGGSTPPTMKAIKINPSVKYIITTSDGVHDNLTPREIAVTVDGKNNPSEIASALLEASKRRSNEIHFRAKKDDISVAVLSLDTTAT